MAVYEFVCNECGRTFQGLTSHIGDEMCPECGSTEISLSSEVTEEPAGASAEQPAPDDPAADF